MVKRQRRYSIFTLPVKLVLFLLLLPVLVQAATYYVAQGAGSGDGSQGAPFASIAQGVSHLQAGDTLLIKGGTYNEEIGTAMNVPNGVTIAGAPGEKVVLTRQIAYATNTGAHDISHKNLTISGATLFYGYDSQRLSFDQGEITNCPGNCMNGGGSGNSVTNSLIHGAPSGNYGFYYWGQNSLIANNEIYNNGGCAIHMFLSGQNSVSNNTVANNYIHDNGDGTHGSCGVLVGAGSGNKVVGNVVSNNFGGISADYRCTNCEITYNTITGSRTAGIEAGLVAGASGTVIRNNIVYGNGGTINTAGDGSAVVDHNYVGDPGFVGGGNYHLASGSPASTYSDTGGEVGAYGNGGGPGTGTGNASLIATATAAQLSAAQAANDAAAQARAAALAALPAPNTTQAVPKSP